MKLSPMVLTAIREVIVPEIIIATEDAFRSYAAATTPNGINYADNWCLGCLCWRILFNRLDARLSEQNFFTKSIDRNVMRISCPNDQDTFTFYVYRVGEESRVPKGGRSVKLYVQQQLWLSEEISGRTLQGGEPIHVLGYDVTLERGLGNITLDRLCARGKRFESVPIHDFGFGAPAPSDQPVLPEEISKPAVKRANDAAEKASGT